MCKHGGLHTHARQDPTRTTTIRNAFERQMNKRFRALKGIIRREIVADDAFGLRTNAGQFAFVSDPAKINGFMAWLKKMQDEQILGIIPGTPVESVQRPWTNIYIESSYQRGMNQAAMNLRGQGVTVTDRWLESSFRAPMHADRAGILYSRAFQELAGITAAMDQQITRVLTQGIIDGDNPEVIARNINNRVDKVGRTRARMLARTEVINAHAEATLNTYQEAGVEGVDVLSEFTTAEDPCPLCEGLEGETYTIEQARGIIPVHPNCRCTWTPKVVGGTGIELT